MLMWALLLAGGLLLTLFVFVLLKARSRNRKLDDWARSVPISDAQLAAMSEQWEAFKGKRIPEADPLARLSKEDKEYIKTICSADFRPKEFGSSDISRAALFMSVLEKGYTPEQAAVIVGMTFNRVGLCAWGTEHVR